MKTVTRTIDEALVFCFNPTTNIFVHLQGSRIIDCSIEKLEHGCHAAEQPEQSCLTLLKLITDDRPMFNRFLDELTDEQEDNTKAIVSGWKEEPAPTVSVAPNKEDK